MTMRKGPLLIGVALLSGLASGILVFRWILPGPLEKKAASAAISVLGPMRENDPGDWDVSLGSRPQFTEVSRSAGISFVHENGQTGTYQYLEIMGAGVGLFDYDGDGYLDIYFVNGNYFVGKPSPKITNRLYHNNGDWTFTDVTERAGVGDTGFGQGCCVGDYDNDGDPDLYVSNYGRNVLYRNNGNGTFSDVTETAGLEDPLWGQSCSFLDYDQDGWLDLYVQNYLTFKPDPKVEAFIYLGDKKVLDYPTPKAFPGAPDHLYRNQGDGTFRDVTETAGIGLPDGRGMGCACVDLDENGYPDIFVANDTMENYFFRNRGDGTFQEDGLAAGVAFSNEGTPEASMGVDVGDYDRDGKMDLINPCLRTQTYTLLRNLGDHFADASWEAGLGPPTAGKTGFNANFFDYDNDGDLDLFFTTGGVRMNETAPANASYQARYGLQDLLLANDGKGRFHDVSPWAGSHFKKSDIGRGSATGDLDNDGDLDLVICNLAGPAVILRNDTASGNWIVLLLIPQGGTRDAFGTRVSVETGGMRQRSVVHGKVTYLSQSDRRIHFGLGRAGKIDRLEILWPDNTRQEFHDLPVNRFLTIQQGVETVP